MKAFVIDVSKCNGCHNCQLACKDEFVGNDWPPYSRPQPQTDQFWCKVVEHTEGTVPKVKLHYVPRLCNHCRNAECMDVCPTDAIYRRDDGFVLIDPEKCVGCAACQNACPYGVIYFNDALGICQKCTGCAHLLDAGYKLPRCVENCPTDAIVFGEEDELADLIRGAEVLKPETGCRPRVYYRNIPGKFIAGTVYDPVEKEVVIGARVFAVTGAKVVETVTDSFGDFWLKDLAVGYFDVTIDAPGFKRKNFFKVDTGKSVNLGDIPLERE